MLDCSTTCRVTALIMSRQNRRQTPFALLPPRMVGPSRRPQLLPQGFPAPKIVNILQSHNDVVAVEGDQDVPFRAA